MASRLLSALAGLFLLLGLALGVGRADVLTARLVILTAEAPRTASVPPGSVVIWLNRVQGRLIGVAFQGEPLPEVECPASVGFVRRQAEVLSLPALPPGGTASLCFPEPGTYRYRILGLDKPLEGAVAVGVGKP